MTEDSVLYAKSLSMLVKEVGAQANPDALKTLLTQARGYSRAAGLQVELRDHGSLIVSGEECTAGTGGLTALADAMQGHGVARISIAEGASPKELLQLALLLAKAPDVDGPDGSIFDQARDLSLWYVRLFPNPQQENESAIVAGAQELGALPASEAANKAAEFAAQIAMASESNDGFRTRALLRLVMDAERVASGDAREHWKQAFDQAATTTTLKLVANSLPTSGDERGTLLALLRRSGDVGANVLINELMTADRIEARRAYFDAIVELRAGVSLLVDMLRHPQWYVIRNAALLLGEMRAIEAEAAIVRLMSHPDERVRIAATTALSQIDTERARQALQQGLHDESAEVRRRSLRGFSGEYSGTSSAALLTALDTEKDPEVQVEILAALGRMRSPDAVQKLIRLCAPSARTAPAAFRIAAAEALTTARGQAAVPFLRAMLDDRDITVRTSARALINSIAAR